MFHADHESWGAERAMALLVNDLVAKGTTCSLLTLTGQILMLFVRWTNALFKSALAVTGPLFVATLIFYSCTRKGINECFHKIQIINEYKSGTRCFYLLSFLLTII